MTCPVWLEASPNHGCSGKILFPTGDEKGIGVYREYMCISFGSIPHPVMGTTRDYCRYIKALLSPC